MADPRLFDHLPLIADSRPGHQLSSMLSGQLVDDNFSPEGLNLQQPETVQRLHEAHVKAGAWLVRTNTLHGHAQALSTFGLSERAEAINNSASALARAAIGPLGAVMATLGPPQPVHSAHNLTGQNEPITGSPMETIQHAVGEQMIYLADTGVDFFLLEHIHQLDWALWLTQKAKSLSDAPVLAQLTLSASGQIAKGIALKEAAEQLVDTGADALGLSCVMPSHLLLPQVETLLNTGLPVSLMLGHGLSYTGDPASVIKQPGRAQPGHAQPLTPDEFAEAQEGFGRMGVAILGGCCGVGVDHVKALATRLGKKPLAETLQGQ